MSCELIYGYFLIF